MKNLFWLVGLPIRAFVGLFVLGFLIFIGLIFPREVRIQREIDSVFRWIFTPDRFLKETAQLQRKSDAGSYKVWRYWWSKVAGPPTVKSAVVADRDKSCRPRRVLSFQKKIRRVEEQLCATFAIHNQPDEKQSRFPSLRSGQALAPARNIGSRNGGGSASREINSRFFGQKAASE